MIFLGFTLSLLLGTVNGVKIQKKHFDVITDIILPKFRIGKINVLCQDAVSVSKRLMGSDIMMRSSYVTKPDESVLFCAEHGNASHQFIHLLGQNYQNAVLSRWMFVGHPKSIDKISKKSNIEINKKVLFVNTLAETVEEIFHVNKETVRNKLLNDYSWTRKTNTFDDVHYRNDLRGLVLKGAMTKKWPPLMYYDPKAIRHIKWKKNKKGVLQTKVSNDQAKGAFVDILHYLEKDLNFTVDMFMSKRNDLGFYKIVNGKILGWTGHIGELLAGEVDILTYPNIYSPDKFGVLSVMHMMDTLTPGLLVSVTAGVEDLEWFTYLLPFKLHTWIVLLFGSLLVLLTARASQILYNLINMEKDLFGFRKHFPSYCTVMFFFAGLPTWAISNDIGRLSQRLLKKLEIVFVFGSLTFMSYKAALTSKLSLQKYVLPFTTLEEFYFSDFT